MELGEGAGDSDIGEPFRGEGVSLSGEVEKRFVDQEENVGPAFRQRFQCGAGTEGSGRVARIAEHHEVVGPEHRFQFAGVEPELPFRKEPELRDRNPRPAAGGFILLVARNHDDRAARRERFRQQRQKLVGTVSDHDFSFGSPESFSQCRDGGSGFRFRIFPDPVERPEIAFEGARRSAARVQIHAEVEQLLRSASGGCGQRSAVSTVPNFRHGGLLLRPAVHGWNSPRVEPVGMQ